MLSKYSPKTETKNSITGIKRKVLEKDENLNFNEEEVSYPKPTIDVPSARMAVRLHEIHKQLDAPEDRRLKVLRDWQEKLHQFGEYKGVNISIEASDTFTFDSPEEMLAAQQGDIGPDGGVYLYSRIFHPTVGYLGRYVAAMEDTESAYCTSSGMSAITATLMHLCKAGGHVVSAETIYGGTMSLLSSYLPEKCNIETTFVDITDLRAVEEAIIPGRTQVLFFEPVANPALIVADISALSKIAHERGVKVVVDNTLTTMILTPVKLGADVSLLSLTKYVSGGADMLAGAICGTKELIKEVTGNRAALTLNGPTMTPMDAFQLVGRMAHTSLRIKKAGKRTLKLAQRMRDQLGLKVVFPGLEDHPEHDLLNWMRNKGYGFGAVMGVDLGTTERAFSLVQGLVDNHFGFLAVSLGYHENLISCPGARNSGAASEPTRKMITKRAHLSPGYVRICVGYMGTLRQKWEQFKKAYEEIGQN